MDIFPFEIAFSHFIQGFADPALTFWMIGITFLGSSFVWIGIALAYYWLHREKEASEVVLLLVLAAGFTEALKLAFHRARPGPEFLHLFNDGVSKYGFPSGHVTLITSQVGARILALKNKIGWKIIGILLILGVGISRIYLGVHFLGDVIGGIVLGGVVAFIAPRVWEWVHHHWSNRKRDFEWMILFLLAIFLAFFLVPGDKAVIGAILGFVAGALLLRDDRPREPLPMHGLPLVKVVLGLFSTLFVGIILLDWVSAPLEGELNIVGLAAYFLLGVYATAFYPLLWDAFHGFFGFKKSEKKEARHARKKLRKRKVR